MRSEAAGAKSSRAGTLRRGEVTNPLFSLFTHFMHVPREQTTRGHSEKELSESQEVSLQEEANRGLHNLGFLGLHHYRKNISVDQTAQSMAWKNTCLFLLSVPDT